MKLLIFLGFCFACVLVGLLLMVRIGAKADREIKRISERKPK